MRFFSMSNKILFNLIAEAKCDYGKISDLLKFSPKHLHSFDEHNNTPLHKAILRGNISLVKMLLDHGANTNISNKMGHTPLHLAVICQNVEMVRLLVALNADVNARSKSGKTPLHLLTIQSETDNSTKIAEILLKNFASTSVKDVSGFTPLDYLNSEN